MIKTPKIIFMKIYNLNLMKIPKRQTNKKTLIMK